MNTSQIVLITGATSGIGRHAALWLAGRGHHVIATGRKQAALDALVAEAGSLRLDAVRLDVADEDSVHDAVVEVHRLTAGYGVDVLINNAGYGQGGAVLDVTLDAVRRQYETNVFGLLAVTRAFAEDMIARGSGRIVNVSSIGGRITLPLVGVYNSTKYAVESLSDALRVELAPFGVEVVIVEPGGINTNFNETVKATVGVDEATLRGGAWGPVYEATDAIFARFEANAPDPTPVSRAFVHAIESRRPRTRYVTPMRDAVGTAILRWMPTRWADALLSLAFGFGRLTHPAPRALLAS